MHTYLYGNIAFCYFSHIEAYCRNHIFCELPRLEYKTKIIFITKQLIRTRKVLICNLKNVILQYCKLSHSFSARALASTSITALSHHGRLFISVPLNDLLFSSATKITPETTRLQIILYLILWQHSQNTEL